MLERLFQLKRHNTTPGAEMSAGVATFLTAAYILAVNPKIQTVSGMPEGALFTATAVSIIIGTLLIGLFANMPFILAPGMGINIYFSYTIVNGMGFTWQEALSAVLVAGALFVMSGLLGLREFLLRCFPETLKQAMAVSLGLMIAVIGLKNSGFIIIGEDAIRLGDATHGAPLVTFLGILVTGALLAMRVPGAILLGIAATTVIGVANGVTDLQPIMEKGPFSPPPSLEPIFMAFSFDPSRLLTVDFCIVVMTLLILDIFDSLGTFVGVLAHFDGQERKLYEERVPRALMCDAVATIAGACVGTSTVTTYVESSTGIAAGGRTGLVSMTIVGLAILSLGAWPLFHAIPEAATAPAMLVVGMSMMSGSHKIAFERVSDGLPAIVMTLVTALTWSISDGLMFGWICYVFFKLVSGRTKELNSAIVAVGIFFLVRLLLL